MEIHMRDGVGLVDDEDALRASGFRWLSFRIKDRAYAYTTIAGRRVYLHHFILNRAPKGRGGGDVDHINGNGLDNRRSNLRAATRQQNNANSRSRKGTSQYKGVSWNAQRKTWQAHIMVDYKSQYLGLYYEEEDAARAYDLAAREAFRDFARLNLPDRIDESAPERIVRRRRTE